MSLLLLLTAFALRCESASSIIYLKDSFLEYEFQSVAYFSLVETKWPPFETVSSDRVGILPTLDLEELFPESFNATAAAMDDTNSTWDLENLQENLDDKTPKFLLVNFPTSEHFREVMTNVSLAAEKMGVDFVILIVHESTPWKQKFAFWWTHTFPGSDSSGDLWPKFNAYEDEAANEEGNKIHQHYYAAVNSEEGKMLLDLVHGLVEENMYYESLFNGTSEGFTFALDDFESVSGIEFVTRIGLYFVAMVLMSRYMGDDSGNNRPSRGSYNRFTGEDLCLAEIQEGSPEQECPICLETLQPNEVVRILPCRHAMHHDCISQWFEQGQYNCPLCKMELSEHMAEQRRAAAGMPGETQQRSWWFGPRGRRINSLNAAQLISTVDEDDLGDLEMTEESPGVLT